MIFTMLPMVGLAADVVASGKCGTNAKWSLDSDGVLTISGSGNMNDYEYYYGEYAPWYDYRSQIQSINITQSVKDIGEFAFYGCTNLISVNITSNMTTIYGGAFSGCSSLEEITVPATVIALILCRATRSTAARA